MKLGVGLGRRLYFPPPGLSFSTIVLFSSSNTSGTIVSLPPDDCWSSSQSFVLSKGVFSSGTGLSLWCGPVDRRSTSVKISSGWLVLSTQLFGVSTVSRRGGFAVFAVSGKSPKLVSHVMTYRSSCGMIILVAVVL